MSEAVPAGHLSSNSEGKEDEQETVISIHRLSFLTAEVYIFDFSY